MKHILSLVAVVFATSCFGQESCTNDIDINGNGTVDITDFLNVLGLFGDVDSDGDGVWDSQDLCLNLEACNYDASPTEPCQTLDVVGVCGGACETDEDQDGVCDVHDCGQPFTYHGKPYVTVQIGEGCWFAENLSTTKLQDGSDILHAQAIADWHYQTDILTPVYCHYQNDTAHSEIFGLLYNGHVAISEPSACPVGWRVANNQDYIALLEEAGAESVGFGSENFGGDVLKVSEDHPQPWNGTNDLGFSALNSGVRRGSTSSEVWYQNTWFWSGTSGANWRVNNSPTVFWGADSKRWGGSIRCVRDL